MRRASFPTKLLISLPDEMRGISYQNEQGLGARFRHQDRPIGNKNLNRFPGWKSRISKTSNGKILLSPTVDFMEYEQISGLHRDIL